MAGRFCARRDQKELSVPHALDRLFGNASFWRIAFIVRSVDDQGRPAGLRTVRRPAAAGISTPNQRANSMVCNQIPYAMEPGIFKRLSGKIFQETGNFHARCFDFEF